jgi:hypothetical protein
MLGPRGLPTTGPAGTGRKLVRLRGPVLGGAMSGTEVPLAEATVRVAEAGWAAGLDRLLRKELLAAMDEGNDAPMRFWMAPVDLSSQVVTEEAVGKFDWHVLELRGPYASEAMQTLPHWLEPVWRQDGSYAGDFAIADQGAQPPRSGPRSPRPRS